VTLVGVMFALALAMWTIAPAVVLWFAPRFVAGHELAYLLTLVGVAVVMMALGAVLVGLNRIYCRLMAIAQGRGRPSAWLRPLCNNNEGRLPSGVLDAVVVTSVLAALLAFAVWFVFFAECHGGSCGS
jgi:hypothetical protein